MHQPMCTRNGIDTHASQASNVSIKGLIALIAVSFLPAKFSDASFRSSNREGLTSLSQDLAATPSELSSPTAQSKKEKALPAQSGQIGTVYRRTLNGWEDSTKWRYKNYPISPQLDAVHPAIWTGLVVGLAMLVLFGCSKDSEVEQWFTELDELLNRDAASKPGPSQGPSSP